MTSMPIPHVANLAVHVAAGIAGIVLGARQLARDKGNAAHRRAGRWFMAATLVVTATALVGTIAFRFMPRFAVLTLLVTYVAVAGWRTATTRERGPDGFDLAWTVAAMVTAAALAPILLRAPHTGSSSPTVVWSSLGGLGAILAYDLLRWTFPRAWYARIWLPEHIYKVVSAMFGMVSAFVGNIVRWGQPWSQVAPTAVGTLVIAYWWWRTIREGRAGTPVTPVPRRAGAASR